MKWETAKEIAYRLRVSYWAVLYWGRKGWIPCEALNRRVKEFYAPRIPPNANVKLNSRQRQDVRRYSKHARPEIVGIIFGVSPSTVRNILANRRQPKSQAESNARS